MPQTKDNLLPVLAVTSLVFSALTLVPIFLNVLFGFDVQLTRIISVSFLSLAALNGFVFGYVLLETSTQ